MATSAASQEGAAVANIEVCNDTRHVICFVFVFFHLHSPVRYANCYRARRCLANVNLAWRLGEVVRGKRVQKMSVKVGTTQREYKLECDFYLAENSSREEDFCKCPAHLYLKKTMYCIHISLRQHPGNKLSPFVEIPLQTAPYLPKSSMGLYDEQGLRRPCHVCQVGPMHSSSPSGAPKVAGRAASGFYVFSKKVRPSTQKLASPLQFVRYPLSRTCDAVPATITSCTIVPAMASTLARHKCVPFTVQRLLRMNMH